MDRSPFDHFVQLVPEEHTCISVVACADWCIGAMERGTLLVHARTNFGHCLWHEFFLTACQWDRICRLRPPVRDIWTGSSLVFDTQDMDANTTLVHIEYLWTDLDVVDNYCSKFVQLGGYYCMIQWIADEVDKRRRWADGLRQAWLVAVVQ